MQIPSKPHKKSNFFSLELYQASTVRSWLDYMLLHFTVHKRIQDAHQVVEITLHNSIGYIALKSSNTAIGSKILQYRKPESNQSHSDRWNITIYDIMKNIRQCGWLEGEGKGLRHCLKR